MQESMADQMNNTPGMDALGGAPPISSIDDYFTTQFSPGLLVRTVNKEKYARLNEDKYLNSMKEASAMGMPMTSTYIINLPRPAKKSRR